MNINERTCTAEIGGSRIYRPMRARYSLISEFPILAPHSLSRHFVPSMIKSFASLCACKDFILILKVFLIDIYFATSPLC